MAESLYTTESPTSETSESPGPTIGTVIKVTVAGHQVTKLKWFAPAESTGDDANIPFVLYDADTQAELARKVASITLGAWNTVTLTTPVAVSLNQRLLPAVKTPTRYTFTSGFFATTDLVVGNLTAPATGNTTGGNGRFHTGGDAYPESTFGGNNYWTDVVLEVVPAGDAIAPDSLAIPLSPGAPTVGQSLTAAPAGLGLPVSLGALTLSQSLTTTPASLSLPVSLGAPSVATAFQGAVAPDSISLPITLGEPRLVFIAPTGASWETLRGIVAEARADHSRNQQRIANPIDCPVHAWPLQHGPNGLLHCQFGGHTVRRGG